MHEQPDRTQCIHCCVAFMQLLHNSKSFYNLPEALCRLQNNDYILFNAYSHMRYSYMVITGEKFNTSAFNQLPSAALKCCLRFWMNS